VKLSLTASPGQFWDGKTSTAYTIEAVTASDTSILMTEPTIGAALLLMPGTTEERTYGMALDERELNKRLLAIEDKMAILRIELPYWLPANLCSKRYALGFAKIGDEWRIAVCEAGYNVESLGKPVALVDAPRSVRAEAAKHLNELVERLNEEAVAFVESTNRPEGAPD